MTTSQMKKRDQKTSKAVAKKYHYMCVWCGNHGTDHAHIISRRFKNTRWVVENGLWMCRKCHMLFDLLTKVGKAFRKHIIKYVVTFWVYDKLKEVRDGKVTAEECGFTEIK